MLQKRTSGRPASDDKTIFAVYDQAKTYTNVSVAKQNGISLSTVSRFKRIVKNDPDRFQEYMTKEEYAVLKYKKDIKGK
ncbi:hypothetical protein HGP28_08970 [Vibrio sp. SM6]|uniref:HTH psq-type domain-containing protein n=1 Tax=Vibrio agarilyticus TaxID=2726741 RepID=A0A7X8TRS8_9VIBR|nr:hypothetical protein [Vibrio agarilyticus]NLS13018.1 hypothetical protein [Vibrio agarilyticus]